MTSAKTLVVAGGGIVGLSVARAAARAGLQVLLLEKNARVGMETSARNSEVVHAGIYYVKDSWKARLCVQGREMLYAFCDEYNVPFRKCGKLIVAASDNQIQQLRIIAQKATGNGVTDLTWLSQSQAKEIEPHVQCHEALYSPSTGIVDSHSLMLAVQGDAEAHGAVVVLSTTIDGGIFNEKSKTFVISATQDGEQHEVECDYFVNATGIFAPLLLDKIVSTERISSQQLSADMMLSVPQLFAKGTYFKLRESLRPFKGLVYPIPEVGGLGVHSTIDMEGNVRFGPDVEWVKEIDYVQTEPRKRCLSLWFPKPDASKARVFAERIRSYWPQISEDELIPDYCGIRPKINLRGSMYEDFYFVDKSKHGVPGLVHLCGFESPGLTSSLAIADEVMKMLE